MSGFSSRSEDVIERKLNITTPDVYCKYENFIDKYDLYSCVKWISDNHLEKVSFLIYQGRD